MKKQISKNKILKFLFYAVAFIGIYGLVFFISPLSDDWYYLTSPHPNFTWNGLLPGDEFWRPFDALFGALMGLIPSLFPALNRAVVVAGHVAGAALAGAIADETGMDSKWRNFTVCFFMFSSAAWAVTVSPDALNQVFSVLFGLIAIYIHRKKKGYFYLVFCMIAILWKESGVSWFFVIPILDAFLDGKTLKGFLGDKKLVKGFISRMAASFAAVILYFVVRFALYGEIALGGSEGGTYDLSLFSFSTVKNAFLLFASGATGVDSIALLGADRSLVLAGITVILSAVFLFTWLISAIALMKRKKKLFPLICLVICTGGLALPLMILGSAGEMHAYPVLCGMAFIFGFTFSNCEISFKKIVVPVLCVFVAFGISSAHKLSVIYDYSNKTEQLTESIVETYKNPEETALFVVVDDWKGYSVFEQSAIFGTYKGYSIRQYFNWVEVKHEQYSASSEEDADLFIQKNSDSYDKVYIVRGEKAERVK